MHRPLSIDFGTSRIKSAYFVPGAQQPELLRFGIDVDRSFAPALFYLPKDSDAIQWGDEAEAQIAVDPAGVHLQPSADCMNHICILTGGRLNHWRCCKLFIRACEIMR